MGGGLSNGVTADSWVGPFFCSLSRGRGEAEGTQEFPVTPSGAGRGRGDLASRGDFASNGSTMIQPRPISSSGRTNRGTGHMRMVGGATISAGLAILAILAALGDARGAGPDPSTFVTRSGRSWPGTASSATGRRRPRGASTSRSWPTSPRSAAGGRSGGGWSSRSRRWRCPRRGSPRLRRASREGGRLAPGGGRLG